MAKKVYHERARDGVFVVCPATIQCRLKGSIHVEAVNPKEASLLAEKEIREIHNRTLAYKELLKDLENEPKTLEDISSNGEKFEKVLEKTIGISFSKKHYSQEELDLISEKLFQSLNEMFPEKIMGREPVIITGSLKKQLSKVLENFPDSILVNAGRIDTKRIRKDNLMHTGEASYGIVMDTPLIEESYNKIDLTKVKIGDYILTEGEDSPDNITNNSNVIGQSISKVVKTHKRLEEGATVSLDSIVESKRNSVMVELLKNKVVDTDKVLLHGGLEYLNNNYPELLSEPHEQVTLEHYYVGNHSSKRRYKFKKISDSVTINTRGEYVTVDKPLYQVLEKKTVPGYTIRAIDMPYSPVKEDVIIHEFAHVLQASGLPGEEELFNKIAKVDEPKIDNKYYKGFPSNYMGKKDGREMFSTLTQAMFCPSNPESENGILFEDLNPYGEDEVKTSLRHWGLGALLNVAIKGNNRIIKYNKEQYDTVRGS